MRSPNLDSNGGQRSQNGMPSGADYNASYYGHAFTGQVGQNYYAPAMPGPGDYTGQHHPNQYYQPHPPVQVSLFESWTVLFNTQRTDTPYSTPAMAL
jgi:hypothetical protein